MAFNRDQFIENATSYVLNGTPEGGVVFPEDFPSELSEIASIMLAIQFIGLDDGIEEPSYEDQPASSQEQLDRTLELSTLIELKSARLRRQAEVMGELIRRSTIRKRD